MLNDVMNIQTQNQFNNKKGNIDNSYLGTIQLKIYPVFMYLCIDLQFSCASRTGINSKFSRMFYYAASRFQTWTMCLNLKNDEKLAM